MNFLENKIQQITAFYQSVLEELKLMTYDNFQEKLASAKDLIILANNLKNELRENYDKELLAKFEGELDALTKQIEETYDNIIEEKKGQLDIAAAELKKLQNQKKIMVYER